MSHTENRIREWLEEPVWWSMDLIPRKIVLYRFVKEGLVPFIRSCGYALGRSVPEIYTYIATGLYQYRPKSVWTDEPYNIKPIPEDQMHFNDVISFDRWAAFWSAWTDWSDVDPDFPKGRERQMDIEMFVWRQLDLDNSPQTEILYYRMHQEEEDEEGGSNRDVYLDEAAGWGGYRK